MGGRVSARPPSPDAGGAAGVAQAPEASGGVRVTGVRAAYGRIEVLHGVDLDVPGGSVFALLGPNGAGKSTLLKVMGGRMRPTAGAVVIDGVSVPHGLPRTWRGPGSSPSPRVGECSPT